MEISLPREPGTTPTLGGRHRLDAARSGKSASVKSGNGHSTTRRTVIVAGVANIVVGLAKLPGP
jgi:hypothetical protein